MDGGILNPPGGVRTTPERIPNTFSLSGFAIGLGLPVLDGISDLASRAADLLYRAPVVGEIPRTFYTAVHGTEYPGREAALAGHGQWSNSGDAWKSRLEAGARIGVEVGAMYLGGQVLGARASAARAPDALVQGAEGAGRMRYPNFSWGEAGGPLGKTNMFGEITIRSGLSGNVFRQTMRHERVHSILSPMPGGAFQLARAKFGIWAYKHSHLVRFLEEAAAETYATRSLLRGINYPMSGYGISPLRLMLEATVYGGAVVGPSAASYLLGKN
jgi:hypothetical protein